MTAPHILELARGVASDLAADGALAVVLAGSQVRDDATELSDIDLYAIGVGAPYALRVVDDRLVAVSWRTEDEERSAFRRPASVGATVPAWRAALVLHDTAGVAERLQREAEAFEWAAIAARCDTWVAETTTGYAEEVLKLVSARRRGDRVVAAIQRSVLALRLPLVMAVQHRLLYETENRLWSQVADAIGQRWSAAHTAALSLRPGEDADRAALTLFGLAVSEVRSLLTPSQLAVVDLALHAAREEADGTELV
ncbi:MAG: hypothetical protein H0U86_12390 [Chloroflexi bacterium]|nr:hypothetical protein [Chloroflexota bacterium]